MNLMRVIFILLVVLLLGISNLSTAQAKPSVLVNPNTDVVSVNGPGRLSVEKEINEVLKNVRVAKGEKVEVLSNNVSILSIMVPTVDKGKQAFTFSVNNGQLLSFKEVVYSEKFAQIMGYDAEKITKFAVTEGGFLLLENSDYRYLAFEKIISVIDINKISGCLNLLDVNEHANGLQLYVGTNGIVVLVLPTNKMQGGVWRQITVPGIPSAVSELNRSYVMGDMKKGLPDYDIMLYSLEKPGEHKLQLEYSVQGMPKEKKDFVLYLQK